MKELIEQYLEQFHENFPLFAVSDMEDSEIEALIRDCLERGSPYTPPDLDDQALY